LIELNEHPVLDMYDHYVKPSQNEV